MARAEILNKIKETLRAIIPDARIILYGSEARGEATENSDIDLLILLDEEKIEALKEKRIKAALCDIELDFNTLISSIIIPRIQWESRPIKTPFYINVTNEGVAL